MKKYPQYKNSTITWLGEIPEHWAVESFKNILTERNEKNNPIRSKERLSLSIAKGVTLYAEKTTNLDRFKDDFTKYKLAHKDDLVFNSMNMIVGAVGVSAYFGCVSPIYYTYYGGLNDSYTKFYEYLFRCKPVQGVLYSLGRGLMAIDRGEGKYNTVRLKVARDDLRSLKLPFPNLSEQIAIANFLDHKLEQIDRFIAKKKQLIELLNEQKAGIINQAVTKGLDKNVPMKPSGIEWLGDIPAHWEVRRLKFLASKTGSGVTPKGGAEIYTKKGIPFLRSQNIHFEGLKLDNVAYITEKIHLQRKSTALKKGDVLLNITGASIGRCCFVPDDFKEGNVNQHVCIIRPTQIINSIYLASVISSKYIQSIIQLEQVGASREALNQTEIKNIPIITPPLKEQKKIITFIKSEIEKLDKTITTIKKEITLVEEYKTALIAEAVTGKIDVRNFQVPTTNPAVATAAVS